MTLHILCHITFPQKGEAGQTLPGLGLAEDAGQGQGDRQAVAVLTAVVDQTQDSVELLPQPALERHPARSLLQREVVNHEAVLVAQLDAECAALPPLAAATPHDEVAGLLEVERLGGGQPVQVRQEPDLPSTDSLHCGGAGEGQYRVGADEALQVADRQAGAALAAAVRTVQPDPTVPHAGLKQQSTCNL